MPNTRYLLGILRYLYCLLQQSMHSKKHLSCTCAGRWRWIGPFEWKSWDIQPRKNPEISNWPPKNVKSMGLSRNHSSVSWSLEPFFRVAKAPSNHPKRFVVLAMVLQFHIQSKPQISSALFMAAWMKIEETTWNAKKNSKKKTCFWTLSAWVLQRIQKCKKPMVSAIQLSAMFFRCPSGRCLTND